MLVNHQVIRDAGQKQGIYNTRVEQQASETAWAADKSKMQTGDAGRLRARSKEGVRGGAKPSADEERTRGAELVVNDCPV